MFDIVIIEAGISVGGLVYIFFRLLELI